MTVFDRGMARSRLPPEHIELGSLILRRLSTDDASLVSEAATESLEHLRPWMPWATPDAVTVEAQSRRLSGVAGSWTPRSGYEFGVFRRDESARGRDDPASDALGPADPPSSAEGTLVAMCGLHRRIGRGALEIGYWVRVGHTHQGIATACAAALTTVGFGLQGVERIEIHCDAANVASARVPARLGYRLDTVVEHEPEAPGEVGRRMVWLVHRRAWAAARPSPG